MAEPGYDETRNLQVFLNNLKIYDGSGSEIFSFESRLAVDGIYGVRTQAAVKGLQTFLKEAGFELQINGRYDKPTYDALFSLASQGYKPEANGLSVPKTVFPPKVYSPGERALKTEKLQEYLNRLEFYRFDEHGKEEAIYLRGKGERINVDGNYGVETMEAVREIQQIAADRGYYKSQIDGLYGNMTYDALCKLLDDGSLRYQFAGLDRDLERPATIYAPKISMAAGGRAGAPAKAAEEPFYAQMPSSLSHFSGLVEMQKDIVKKFAEAKRAGYRNKGEADVDSRFVNTVCYWVDRLVEGGNIDQMLADTQARAEKELAKAEKSGRQEKIESMRADVGAIKEMRAALSDPARKQEFKEELASVMFEGFAAENMGVSYRKGKVDLSEGSKAKASFEMAWGAMALNPQAFDGKTSSAGAIGLYQIKQSTYGIIAQYMPKNPDGSTVKFAQTYSKGTGPNTYSYDVAAAILVHVDTMRKNLMTTDNPDALHAGYLGGPMAVKSFVRQQERGKYYTDYRHYVSKVNAARELMAPYLPSKLTHGPAITN